MSRRICIYNSSDEPTFRKWWLADDDNSLSSIEPAYDLCNRDDDCVHSLTMQWRATNTSLSPMIFDQQSLPFSTHSYTRSLQYCAKAGKYALLRSSVLCFAASLVGSVYSSEDPTPAEPLNFGCPLNPSKCKKNVITYYPQITISRGIVY